MATPVDIPTVTYATREAMETDQAAAPWFQNRYVMILSDELYSGGFSYHLFRNGTMYTLVAPTQAEVAGVPPGGSTGQILAKQSDADFDAIWIDNIAVAPETFALLLAPGARLKIKPDANLKIN